MQFSWLYLSGDKQYKDNDNKAAGARLTLLELLCPWSDEGSLLQMLCSFPGASGFAAPPATTERPEPQHMREFRKWSFNVYSSPVFQRCLAAMCNLSSFITVCRGIGKTECAVLLYTEGKKPTGLALCFITRKEEQKETQVVWGLKVIQFGDPFKGRLWIWN